jgi:hypothetical protein
MRSKLFLRLIVPALRQDGFGTLPAIACGQVVKASSGHIPQLFLISVFERTDTKVNAFLANRQKKGC